jgi:glycosyltransferase involved in cell wall biosynthesis
MKDTVSVIIPTFNRWETLPRALTSVHNQTRAPDQVIVVDDGSTDDTADRIAADWPNVICLRQENRGVSAARNTGIRAATGQWLAFLDSDDEWLPDKLQKQLAALAEQPLRICHTDEIWIRNGQRVKQPEKYRKSGGFIFQKCLPVCAIGPSTVLIHRDLFDRIGLFDESSTVCEDYDLWLRICCDTEVLYVDEALIRKYGGHADQLSTQTWGIDRFRIKALQKIIDSNRLRPDDRKAATATMLEKIDVYIAGARKRGKDDDVAAYEQFREQALCAEKKNHE